MNNRSVNLLGEKIRSIRKSLKISQEELAQKIGVSNKTISAYESGRAIPPTKILLRISKVTNTPLQNFFSEKTEKEDSEKEELLRIIKQIGILKRIKRVGWSLKGIDQVESVADHDFRTAVLALLLASQLELDREKLIKMALIRDIGKVGIGEKVWESGEKKVSSPREKVKKEQEVIKSIFGRKPEYKELFDLWNEWNRQKTKEARVLRQISKLEMVIQALEYEIAGYPSEWFDEFWENAEKYLKGQELEPFFNFLKSKREHERSH
ncbi:HD domain-containing protein [bacterium]|nr:HD domain-containing protein [bacterium]